MEKNKELAQRYLVLLKIDAVNLFDRINSRHKEFMDDFSLKRDRSIFNEVFFTRYHGLQFHELAHFSVEIIELANSFYQKIDELHWYLMQTQDMPTTIEDQVIRYCSQLHLLLDNLTLYIDAEMSGTQVAAQVEMTDEQVETTDSLEEWQEESDF